MTHMVMDIIIIIIKDLFFLMSLNYQTNKLLGFYPKSFQQEYLIKYKGHYSPLTIKAFERQTKCSHCTIELQFIDTLNYSSSDLKKITINLSNPKWFEYLCKALKVNDVYASGGISIKNFKRNDFVRNHGLVYTHTKEKDWKMMETLKDHNNRPFRAWWCDFINHLRNFTLDDIVSNVRENIHTYLNNNYFEKNFIDEVSKYLKQESHYKKYDCESFEEFIEHFSKIKLTKTFLINFLLEHVIIPLKFLITSTKGLFKNYVKTVNEIHIQSSQPVNITKKECESFYFTMVSNIYSPLETSRTNF